MDNAVIVLVVCAWICTVGAVFEDDIKNFFLDLEGTYREAKSCIEEARAMGNFYGGIKGTMNKPRRIPEAKKNAIAMINLYTQECYIDPAKTRKFNSEMKKEENRNTPFWTRARELIDVSINELGESTLHPFLFHGRKLLDDVPGVNSIIRFGVTTSTTLDIWTALQYNRGALVVMCDTTGPLVRKYSQFYQQYEVLVRSTASYKVLKVETDADEIGELLKDFRGFAYSQPTQVIGVRMETNRRKRAPPTGRTRSGSESSDVHKRARSKEGATRDRPAKKAKAEPKKRFAGKEEKEAAAKALVDHFC